MKERKRVLIDLSHIRDSYYVAIANAAIEITKGLVKYSNFDIILLVWENHAKDIDKLIGKKLIKIILPISERKYLDRKFVIHFSPSFLDNELNKHHIDLVFTTCYTDTSYVFPKKYNQLGIVYDMQPFKIWKMEHSWIRMIYYFCMPVLYYRLIPHITTISNFTAKDVWKYSRKKATPIYLSVKCVEKDITIETPIPEIIGKKIILDINSFQVYKNTERIIDAFAIISNKIPHMLYLKGYGVGIDKEKRFKELTDYVELKGLSDRIILDISHRTNEEISYLFNHTDLFVSPSLMEGFGFTPIEASIHKRPVIVSNIETLVEVTDGLVGTFDPYSVESIANAIIKTLSNPPSEKVLESIAEHYKTKYAVKPQIDSYISLIENILDNKI